VCLGPKLARHANRVDACCGPPAGFVAGAVQLAMMSTAERYGELVADFEPERSGLRKPQVMRVGRLAAADQAGL
jgi:hypothetical protein